MFDFKFCLYFCASLQKEDLANFNLFWQITMLSSGVESDGGLGKFGIWRVLKRREKIFILQKM